MEAFVADAISSVLGQTYPDLELIVVDDGSTDDTAEVISRFGSDDRVRCVRQDNRGLAGARNRGIRESHAPLIAFLDADDVWLPPKLEKQMAAFDGNPAPDVVYCAFTLVDVQGHPLPTAWDGEQLRPSLHEELMYRNVIAGSGSSVLLRSRCFDSVGMFDENLQACEDIDMWRRLALGHRFFFLNEPLVHVRRHPGNMQSNFARMASSWEGYIAKMKRDTLPQYRHHLPHVSRKTYCSLALAAHRSRQFSWASYFLLRILALGPRHWVAALRDARVLFRRGE